MVGPLLGAPARREGLGAIFARSARPALAGLLAGPALSLPSILVINTILGTKRTATYVGLVIVMATFTGWTYGAWVG